MIFLDVLLNSSNKFRFDENIVLLVAYGLDFDDDLLTNVQAVELLAFFVLLVRVGGPVEAFEPLENCRVDSVADETSCE